jgi:hypothetical protein
MATPTVKERAAFIRQEAAKRGIDPAIAVRVARSEGLGEGIWQSNVVKGGRRETSYGDYQLLVGGGLGDQFKKATGLNPSDKSTWKEQIQFALDYAADNGWGSWYGAAKVGVNKWDGLKGAQPVGISQPSDTAAAETASPEMAGGLGALLSGDWVEPMLAANQDRIGNRIESAFAPGAMPAGPAGALERLASLGADPASARVAQASGGLGGVDPASARVGSAFSTAMSAPPVGGDPTALARAAAAMDPASQRVGQAFAAGPAVQQLNPGAPAAIDRIRAEYAARTAPPTVQASTVGPVTTPTTSRLPAAATMATGSINPAADPRAAAYATGIKPGQKQVVTPQSLANVAKIAGNALLPIGQNLARIENAVRFGNTPSDVTGAYTEAYPDGTEEMAGRVRRVESKGQPGGSYAGSGLSATMSVRSGTTPVGTIAHSRSDPSVSLVSLPGGKVAHVNDKHGFISTWSPADDDELGTSYGKTLAIDPTGSKYGYYSPGKVPTGWATYSPGKGFSKGIAAVSNARSYGPGIFGGLTGNKSGQTGKSALGGILGGLFGGRGVAPGKSLGNQAVGQALGLAAGLFGPAAGMGGLGIGAGFDGPAGQVGGLGAPGFGGQISSNSNYGGK